jgi:hypothetical protein
MTAPPLIAFAVVRERRGRPCSGSGGRRRFLAAGEQSRISVAQHICRLHGVLHTMQSVIALGERLDSTDGWKAVAEEVSAVSTDWASRPIGETGS